MSDSYKSVIERVDTAEVQLVIGEDVYQLLSDINFQAGWDELYESCSWSTVFQSRSFVCQWYQIYQKEYLPIVVKSYKGDRLNGLLTMALPLSDVTYQELQNAKGNIIGAGQYDAEYQVWLVNEADEGLFIKQALKKIRSQFPNCNIQFRFIPSNTPINWLKEDIYKKNIVIQALKRPLMDTKDPEFINLSKKHEFRNKLNRLKKLGEVNFFQIKDFDSFNDTLQEVKVQFDFRQGAMFNKNQFKENPLKSEFLEALFKLDLLHVTALKVNDEIVACVIALKGTTWIFLGGINVHSPFHANYYSPGFVHFIMLGQYLAQEGFEVFDLTPGGDFYKNRLATRYDHVYELIIPGSSIYKVKKRLRKQLHYRLIKAGLRPMSIELSIRRIKYLLKNKASALRSMREPNSIAKAIKTLLYTSKPQIYSLSSFLLSSDTSVLVKQNSLQDLLSFEQNGGWLTRWEFLNRAMRRYEVGEQSFSWFKEGRLLCCVWLTIKTEVPDGIPKYLPEGAILLQGLYYHTLAKNYLPDFLATVINRIDGNNENNIFLINNNSELSLPTAAKIPVTL